MKVLNLKKGTKEGSWLWISLKRPIAIYFEEPLRSSHASHVTCHVSLVTCHMSKYFFFYIFLCIFLSLKKFNIVVELVSGKAVINEAYPV